MAGYRSGKLAVLWRASDCEADRNHQGRIKKELDIYGIASEYRVASAHKSPELCLQILEEYRRDPRQKVILASAGRSDGLGHFLSANSPLIVIACPVPPGPGEYDGSYLSSSLDAPSYCSPLVIKDPKTAARAAAVIHAQSDPELWDFIEEMIRKNKQELAEADRRAHSESSEA